METFYFGRLNSNTKYDIFELLSIGKQYRPLKKKDIKYGVFSIEKIEDTEFGNVITGELVKYQDYKEEPVVKDNKLSKEYIMDYVQGTSRFYLMEKSHLIAYNPYGNVISPKAFCDAFVGVINASDDTFNLEAEIRSINIEYKFLEFLDSMQTISKLTINLTPSNPESGDLWEEIDQEIIKMNAKSYKEEIVAKDNLSLNIDDERIKKIYMAQDGYGKATAHGTDENSVDVSFSTNEDETVMKKKVEGDLTVKEQFDRLKKVFRDIIGRIKRS